MKMSLKCQFCGKEYLHDRKICRSCEEKAISSGLNSQDRSDHKWRCDNFLEQSALPFGRRISKCNEPRETPHREKLEKNNYEWNIFSSIKFNNVQNSERKLNYLLKFE